MTNTLRLRFQIIQQFLEFVNETPVAFAGDRRDTNGAKCLKCGAQMRISANSSRHKMPDGSVMEFDEYDCPQCDLGES